MTMAAKSTKTKTRIINAARTLYSTHGCDGTTLDDILTASGVTKGAFYHYFKSKESLCEDLIDEVIFDYQQIIDSIDTTASPLDQLNWLIRTLDRKNLSGEWVNCRLVLRLSADAHESHQHIQKKLRQFWQWYTSVFEELIVNCRNANQLTTSIPLDVQLRMLMSLIAGSITLERITRSESSFAELTDLMLKSMMP